MNIQDLNPENDRYTIELVEQDIENVICIIKTKGSMPHLCGYVGVPYESNLFGLPYIGWLERSIQIHGGLTAYLSRNPKGFRLEGIVMSRRRMK